MLRADPYTWHPFLAAAVPWAPRLSSTEHRAHLSSCAGVLMREGRLSRSASQKYTAEACLAVHLLPGLRAEAPQRVLACRGLRRAAGMAHRKVGDAAACPLSCLV